MNEGTQAVGRQITMPEMARVETRLDHIENELKELKADIRGLNEHKGNDSVMFARMADELKHLRELIQRSEAEWRDNYGSQIRNLDVCLNSDGGIVDRVQVLEANVPVALDRVKEREVEAGKVIDRIRDLESFQRSADKWLKFLLAIATALAIRAALQLMETWERIPRL